MLINLGNIKVSANQLNISSTNEYNQFLENKLLENEFFKDQLLEIETLNESEIELLIDNSFVIFVPKPIKAQGRLSTKQMETYIKRAEDGANKTTLIAFLGSALVPSVGTVIGGIGVIANYVYNTTTIDRMKLAVDRGESLYWVQVYASGVSPSLSTQSMKHFSTKPVIFVHDR